MWGSRRKQLSVGFSFVAFLSMLFLWNFRPGNFEFHLTEAEKLTKSEGYIMPKVNKTGTGLIYVILAIFGNFALNSKKITNFLFPVQTVS